jgi:hypothetical protein
MSRAAGWTRGVAYVAVAATVVACGDLVNHDDERPARKIPVAALYLDDGHPTVLFAPCEDSRVTQLTVSDGVRQVWIVYDNDPPEPTTTIRIFTVPAGWTLDKLSAADFTTIAPDHPYRLSAALNGGIDRATSDSAVDNTFTLADLTALRPDQVWAAGGPTSAPAAMSRDEFRRLAAAPCGG